LRWLIGWLDKDGILRTQLFPTKSTALTYMIWLINLGLEPSLYEEDKP